MTATKKPMTIAQMTKSPWVKCPIFCTPIVREFLHHEYDEDFKTLRGYKVDFPIRAMLADLYKNLGPIKASKGMAEWGWGETAFCIAVEKREGTTCVFVCTTDEYEKTGSMTVHNVSLCGKFELPIAYPLDVNTATMH